jgi:hypothetical protein
MKSTARAVASTTAQAEIYPATPRGGSLTGCRTTPLASAQRLVWAALAPALLTLPAPAQEIDLEAATRAIAERQVLCERDDGALWGVSLCGPLLIVDPASRSLAASQNTPRESLRREGGTFIGRLPEGVLVANTAVEWEGVRWSMVQSPLPTARREREALLMHESWHRIQDGLGLPPRSPNASHLATEFGRTSLREEWRALAAALTAPRDADRRAAIRDALIFRAWRRRETHGAANPENQLELNEGLAEYTGRRLSGQDARAVAAALADAEKQSSFVRTFAYASGPAYGYLLDRYGSQWRRQLSADSNLAFMLAAEANITLPDDIAHSARIAGSRYGLEEVVAQEKAAAYEQEAQAGRWKKLLVTGPVLHLKLGRMKLEFNPNNLFPLPPYGTVYPTLQVIDSWGKLTVRDGALIDEKWSGVTLSAPSRGGLSGPGWTLELNPGWSMQRRGRRPDEFVIAEAE